MENRTIQQNTLKIGDTIKCRDKDDMFHTDRDLCEVGYETEYLYEKNGKAGYWIEIQGITEV